MVSAALPVLRTSRVIAGALTTGPVLFWIVAWFLIDLLEGGVQAPDSGFTPTLALWVWLAVALPCFALGLHFRGRAVAVVEGTRVGEDAEAANQALGEIQAGLFTAWSLFEGPALLSGVFFLLFAVAEFVYVGAAVLGIGMLLSFPRREWYEPFERVVARASRVEDASITEGR